MHTFSAGSGRVQRLAFTPDGRSLVVDLRGELGEHPWLTIPVRPAWELAWWDTGADTPGRRFRLRDALCGPGGYQSARKDGRRREDDAPEEPALDVSFCVEALVVATAWKWTNKEDGVCTFDVDRRRVVDLRTPYKTHTERLCLAPDGTKLAAATVNNMDGSSLFQVWELVPPAPGQPPGPGERVCWNNLGPLADLAFDGRFVAAADGTRPVLLLWDSAPARGQEGASPPGAAPDAGGDPEEALEVDVGFAPRCLAFAPFGALVAVGGDGLLLFDPALGYCRQRPRTGAAVTAVGFSPDGSALLAGTAGGTVEWWDNGSGQLLRTFEWDCGPVSAVAMAPDGRSCALGTEAGRIIVWDSEAKIIDSGWSGAQ
jgi:hypothetical protein